MEAFRVFLFMGIIGFAFSSSISDEVFNEHGLTGRNLLQAKKSCSVNFEFLNYTIITSQCKGPQYPASLCCPAFKEFACPYTAQINDMTTDCASTMFSYINLYGKYPPGLFSSECKDDKQGLDCASVANQKNSLSSGEKRGKIGLLSLILAGFVVVMFLW